MTSVVPDLVLKSPSTSKRHKCPYCDTEFTRHHNLKSHLLTHSQEKPYVCQHCDMRFRRLHDLKRHSKLHTGEKPHICPRCDRKFARGDALARHSKGAGGCAGRRSGSGVFGSSVLGGGGGSADDSFDGNTSLMDTTAGGDDSVMSGIEYEGGGGDDDNDNDDERRRLSLPIAKMDHVHGRTGAASGGITADASFGAAQHARTYPPVSVSTQPRPAGGLYPPHVGAGVGAGGSASSAGTGTASTAASTVATTVGSAHTPTTGVSLFSPQHGIAESPKALSPAITHDGTGLHSALTRPGNSGSPGAANIFSSEQGMWTYIQSLKDKLKEQDERIRQQDERLAQVDAEKLALEGQIELLKRELATVAAAATVAATFHVVPEPSQAPAEEPAAHPAVDVEQEAPAAVEDTEPKPLHPEADSDVGHEEQPQEQLQTAEPQLEQQVGQDVEAVGAQ